MGAALIWRFLKPALPFILSACAIIGAIWWVYHSGFQAAEEAAQRRNNELHLEIAKDLLATQGELQNSIDAIDDSVTNQIAGVRSVHTETQLIIEREIANDPRFSDPALGLSDSMFAAINRTRAALACTPTPEGGINCALPPTAPAGDKSDR